MIQFRSEAQKEQLSKAQLQEELLQLKNEYERANADLDSLGKIDPKEAAKKLQQLQEQFVGGEQAGNEQLKQRRMKKLNDARTKTEKLAGKLTLFLFLSIFLYLCLSISLYYCFSVSL